jgi:hypothetical protein
VVNALWKMHDVNGLEHLAIALTGCAGDQKNGRKTSMPRQAFFTNLRWRTQIPKIDNRYNILLMLQPLIPQTFFQF